MTTSVPLSSLGQTMAQLMEIAREGDPAKCYEPISGMTRQTTGLRSEGRFGDQRVIIDEPVSFGGTGTAPNPAEVLLAALGASLEVTLRCYADYWGIPVHSVGVKLSAALDNRAFFGTDSTLRAGFAGIDATVNITSDASREVLDSLLKRVEQCCPMLDVIRAPTPVRLSLEIT